MLEGVPIRRGVEGRGENYYKDYSGNIEARLHWYLRDIEEQA